MIARLLWWTALAALGVVTLLAQLDRSSRFSPSLSPLVPETFAGFAAARSAQRAVLAQEPETSLAASRALIAVRPLPSEHLTLLAQAQIQSGDETAAIATLEAATKRGWRDPLAQIAAAQGTIADENYAAAALRIDALFATGSAPEPALALLASLLASEGGRDAFAERMATNRRWTNNLLNPASNAVPPADLAPTLALAQAKGAELSCAALQRIADRYAADDLAQEAEMIDLEACS